MSGLTSRSSAALFDVEQYVVREALSSLFDISVVVTSRRGHRIPIAVVGRKAAFTIVGELESRSWTGS